MNKFSNFIATLCLLVGTCIMSSCNNNTVKTDKLNQTIGMDLKDKVKPPIAKKVPKEMTIHGDTRVDNYYWMNQREDPEVIQYLNDENAHTASVLEHTNKFQEKLYTEIVDRIKQEDNSVPYKKDGYYYVTRYEKGKEHPIYTRHKDNMEAPENIMLDVNELAKPYSYYAVGSLSVSPDNKILMYAEDTLSRRIYTIKFKNLETGEMLEDVIPGITPSVAWGNDNQHIFYTVKDESLRPYKIFRHKLGTPTTDDVEVYHEKDETFNCYVWRSKSKKYIMIGSFQTVSSEFRYLDADNPTADFKVFQPRERNLEYSVSHVGDRFLIRTNKDAKNFQLMESAEDNTTKENWKTVVAHRDDVLLEGFEVFKNHMVLEERIKGISNLRVMSEKDDHYIDFGEDAYLAYTSTNPEFETDVVRIGFTSLTTPNSTFDYDMNTKKLTLLKEQEVVGDFDKTMYKSERIYAKVRDGVEVPISIVYHKDTKLGPDTDLLLYGYGSYGNSMDPYFSSVRLSLLDRGFVFAIAHIRGGEEMGRKWYEDGKLLNKKNTFYDFIDCGEHLIKNNYTSSANMYAQGGSAGGLLVGAVINYRPDLFNGVIAAVPFVDVVTTMLDETIPLTTGEFDEWGNPKEKKYYDYIKSYSPYDNVEKKDYPHLLITTGLHDSQVQYWEPAKWIAKLRDYKTDNNKLLLDTNMDAGHGGSSGRFARYKKTALNYAFLLDLAGKGE